MTAPDKRTPGELANRVESFAADIDDLPPGECRISVLRDDSVILRAAAAALRSLTAERDRLHERLEVVEREANWDREVAHPDQVGHLRRKVAKYITEARAWRLCARDMMEADYAPWRKRGVT